MMTKFLIGSRYFFDCYKNYKVHDKDYLILEDNPQDYEYVKNIRGNGLDIFYWRRMTAKEFIDCTLINNTPLQIGKFLIPEFASEINLTIEELNRLEPLTGKLDDKHKYEKIIWEAYIENGEFNIYEEQRDKAYEMYKRYRNEIYL